MPKQARVSGIKSLWCYTIEQAAEVSGVSPRTIRNWGSDGLRFLDDARPVLIRGDDLRDYIKGRRDSRKVKTALDEFYCFRCGKARKAARGLADCTITSGRVMLTALCGVCETVVCKPVPEACIPEISRTLDLTIKRHEETL
jgi:transcription elongation factor Elf1